MSNCSQPVTEWRNNKIRKTQDKDGLEELWDKVIGDKETPKEVCLESQCEIVSIRCRRHKKRFNVTREWVNVCGWLCPKCYDKISIEERRKFAPANETNIDIRKPEDGKPIVFPIAKAKGEDSHLQRQEVEVVDSQDCNVQRQINEQNNQSQLQEKDIEEPILKKPSRSNRVRYKEVSISPYLMSPDIAVLMPLWRLGCQRCRREMPVHKIWIDNSSKVLCPECYSQMSSKEVEAFHRIHPDSSAVIRKVEPCKIALSHRSISSQAVSNVSQFHLFESTDESFGGHCKSSTIMRMTAKELIEAVRCGRVSKVRARIEMNRRKNASYFNELPDVNPVTPILPR